MLLRTLLFSTLVIFGSQFGFAQKNEVSKATDAVSDCVKADSALHHVLNDAYGYAVLPAVGKGAIGIGGASGNGTLFKQGVAVGDVDMKQVTIGFQFGGQSYIEIILFEDSAAYERFVEKDFEFAAQASAVALSEGASAHAAYKDGIMILTMAKGGLMYEASVGGQRFKVHLFE